MGYLPLYFSGLGFSPLEIAVVSGAENVAMLVGPPLLSARMYPQGLSIAILSTLAGIALIPCILSTAFWTVLVFFFLSLLFSRANFAAVNEFAVRSELEGKLRYSDVRIWGSISFIVAIYVLGVYADVFGVSQMMVIAVAGLFVQAIFGVLLPDSSARAAASDFRSFFKNHVDRRVVILWITLMFLWASHSPVYTYLSIHLRHHGWETSTISWAWNICVVSEIIVFAAFTRIEQFCSLRSLVLFSLIAAVIRWLILGWTVSVPIVLLVQALHGFTYGAVFIATQKLVAHGSAPEARKMAQAVLMAFSSGLGSLGGKLLAGLSARQLDLSGDFAQLFTGASVIALVAVLCWLRFPAAQPQARSSG